MKRLILSFSMLALFLFPSAVHADVAPPINPPGSNPQPGTEPTQVRMVAETVLVDVQKDLDLRSLGSAMITADFSMRNLGNASESMAVRFPIAAQNGHFEYPEITDLKITVDRKKIEYRRTRFPDEADPSQMIPWAEFDITFPPGQDVSIQVKYKLKGSGYAPYTAFYYILESGAGWKDTIGSADIILRLPYEANPQNVVIGLQIGWAQTTPGGVFQGNEVRWHFDNFEPGPHEAIHNMEFALVAPSVWNNLLITRANVSRSPNDSEAWGQLGKAYKSIFLMHKYYREDDAGKELYKLAVEAYEKCLALNPKDAQWHAGFADLLANHAFWDSFLANPTIDVYRAFNEIHTALELAPKDARVLEIADSIYLMFPEGMIQTENGYDFPWLTQTPTPLPVPLTIAPAESTVATSPVEATATLVPRVANTPLPISSPGKNETTPAPKTTPPCGAAALAPLTIGIWLVNKRKLLH